MTKPFQNMLIVLLIFIGGPVFAHQQKPDLPNVLIIGDSIYQQHCRGVASELKEEANVQFASWPKLLLPNSTNAIKHIDQLLGLKDASGNDVPEDKRLTWDVIHFNVGLGDLVYCVPNLKSHRVLPYDAGGMLRTDAKRYEDNLDTLVHSLRQKAPDARLVWASTTPIRHSREHVFKLGTEIEYNQIAERVMKKHGVPINEMYAYARSLIDMDKPAPHGFDPFFFDRKPLHPPVVDAVRTAIGIR